MNVVCYNTHYLGMKCAAEEGSAKPAKTFKETFFVNHLFGGQALTDHNAAMYSTVPHLNCT